MSGNDRGRRGATPARPLNDDTPPESTPPGRPDLERLGVGAWLARLDEIEDHGHEGYWLTLERLARRATYATGADAYPSLRALAGAKVSERTVRRHLRLAEALGLIVVTHPAGPKRGTTYALAWPLGATPGDVAARLVEARRVGTPDRAVSSRTRLCPPGQPGVPPTPDSQVSALSGATPDTALSLTPDSQVSANLLRPPEKSSSSSSGEGWGPDEPYPVGPDKGPLDAPPDTRPWPARDPEADLRAVLDRDPTEDELRALRSALRVAAEQRASDPRRRALVHAVGEAMRRGRTPDGPGWAAAVVRRMTLEEQDERVQALERALRRPAPRPAVPKVARWIGVTPSRIDCRDRIESLERAIAQTRELGEEPDPRTIDELETHRALLAAYEAGAR